MSIAIPNVTGILYKNRATTYVEDAKKLATTAEYKIRGSNSGIVKPGNGQCVVMNLAYLDNTEFDEPPNGGEYMKNESYVVIKKNGSSYEYYVQLLEKIKENTAPRGISLINSSTLYKSGATEKVENVPNNKIFGLSSYNFAAGTDSATIDANNAKANELNGKIGTSVVTCNKIVHVYAID